MKLKTYKNGEAKKIILKLVNLGPFEHVCDTQNTDYIYRQSPVKSPDIKVQPLRFY